MPCSCGDTLDVAAVREDRVLALDDAKALHAVEEECGHRDVAAMVWAQLGFLTPGKI